MTRNLSRPPTAVRVPSSGSGNLDDGNLNYDKGDLTSNMFRATGELTLGWKNFGLFVRGYAFYDFENEDGDRLRTNLGSNALDQIGSDAKLLDAYVTGYSAQAQYLTRMKVNLAYTEYSGGGAQNLISDRDNLSFSMTYDF